MQALSLPVLNLWATFISWICSMHTVIWEEFCAVTNCSIWLVVHCNTVMKVGVTMGLVAVKTS